MRGNDPAFAAEALALPPEVVISEQLAEIDPQAVHEVRLAMRRFLAERLREPLLRTHAAYPTPGPYSPDAVSSGRRALRNLCPRLLVDLGDATARGLCVAQLAQATNMTRRDGGAVRDRQLRMPRAPARARRLLRQVAGRGAGGGQVAGRGGAVAPAGHGGARARAAEHPAFTLKNPNKVYALLGSFGVNQVELPRADGSGYQLMMEQALALDAINPQVASRMVRNFERYRRFEPGRQALMRAALQKIAATPGLSEETGGSGGQGAGLNAMEPHMTTQPPAARPSSPPAPCPRARKSSR
jgi:aminopeptidase N